MELRYLFNNKEEYINSLYECLEELNIMEDCKIKTYSICNILKELFEITGAINDIH